MLITDPVVDHYDIEGVFNLVIGDRHEVGDPLLNDQRIPLISATGSTLMGKKVAATVGERLGRSLLELGGNNAITITTTTTTTTIIIIITEGCNLDVMEYDTFEEVIRQHNGVPQGLSSALFTHSIQYQEKFLSARGSDCGIANVNIGTSGAEIGGAFGGEKETGGGREAGSDAWKAYMRRQTNTINWGDDLPLPLAGTEQVQSAIAGSPSAVPGPVEPMTKRAAS